MLRPHAPGTFIRLWRPSRVDVDVHRKYTFEDGVALRCKYCRWEAGTYHDRVYIRDQISGWWEEDPGICECIYFDCCNTLITRGTRFLVPGTLQVHTCDCPWRSFVLDIDELLFRWKSVIAIASFRPMGSFGIPRWRRRMHDKDRDMLGRCLSLRDWIRVRRCTVNLRDSEEIVRKAVFHGTAWRRVTALYTLDDQLAHDAAYAHTIAYLPIDAIVLPVMSLAPAHIAPVGWLWAKFRLPEATQSSVGWIHPHIIHG